MDADIFIFVFTKLIHKSCECGIMSEITLNITLHGSNCIILLRHFIP